MEAPVLPPVFPSDFSVFVVFVVVLPDPPEHPVNEFRTARNINMKIIVFFRIRISLK
jgi:hypothetical protein